MAMEDGGPAFPTTLQVNAFGTIEQEAHDGMSLRDWFAGQALAGLLPTDTTHTNADLAQAAYNLADAMLAARERKGG